MIPPVPSRYLVPFDQAFDAAGAPTGPPQRKPKKHWVEELAARVEALRELQHRLHAQDRFALLVVFQAMDASGKDSTIRAVMSGVNPAGCQVYSFKAPSAEELDHDFLWRSVRCLPERGRIGVFNRSYYEEVLVVRVHTEHLAAQKLPRSTIEAPASSFWEERFGSIRDHELHLARNGTVVVKFWLHVSRDEQRRRFLSRIDRADKHWKFSAGDLDERALWPQYMDAFGAALTATSRPWAPWYAIPADDKRFMHFKVADILVRTLEAMKPEFPVLPEPSRDVLRRCRERLLAEDQDTDPG